MNLSRKSKIILVILIVLIGAAVWVYQYSMKPPAQIEDKKVEFTGTAEELFLEVQKNAADWQDKVVMITGGISSTDEKGIVLSPGVFCQMKNQDKISSLSANQSIKLKGRVIGYDDLLEELKLDQCIIQQ